MTDDASSSSSSALSIKDKRTGKSRDIAIHDGTIPAMDLREFKTSNEDFGLMSYDPAFMNTASCKSAITYIDGDKGILRYRGYPIEELAEKRNYLEVAYLLLKGELPGKSQYDEWVHNITYHTMVHENVKKFLEGFRYDAHPMGMLVSSLAALSTFYQDARNIFDPDSRMLQTYRLIGKTPTLAAYAYRHTQGHPYIYPNNGLYYTENFLTMMWKPPANSNYKPDPVLVKALDTLFILHADHEQNASTSAMRGVGSTHADPYSSAAAAAAALYGPLHGGANEQVLLMLEEIGSVDKIPETIRQVKDRKKLLMGFGHRVYKNYDPRARIVKKIADEVFEVTGKNKLLDIALELERIALSDDYFISKHLYPNVDFYSGIIYQAMGFPKDIFTVLFAIPRMSGWLAQWHEMLNDPEQKIARPRQIYIGSEERHVPSTASK